MNSIATKSLVIIFLLVTGAYFLFNGLASAQGFLAPLVIAILLSMILIPVAKKLEKWGIKRMWASFFCTLIIVLAFLGIFAIISAEISSLASDWSQMQKKLQPKIERVHNFLSKHQLSLSQSNEQNTGNPKKKEMSGGDSEVSQNNKANSSASFSSNTLGVIGSMATNFFSLLGSSLLTFVYIFFFLLYRDKFEKAALKFFPEDKKSSAKDIIEKSTSISQDYLAGRIILIVFLGILYSIGLTISGIKHSILISVLAAILTLIPYIGNIIGVGLALAMALLSGGSIGSIVGVLITFSIVQFIESYFLEPYILGHRVDLNPVITIIAVVLGGAVWGAVGMIIAIPVIGIFKIISDHVPFLHPLGYTLGEKDIPKNKTNKLIEKLKNKFKK